MKQTINVKFKFFFTVNHNNFLVTKSNIPSLLIAFQFMIFNFYRGILLTPV